ncbi:hypothetical protein J9896_08745 [Acinetobacter baumannii]|uniref:hypothetical protein n=1 Tax=Acinetobacter baumannii TaxID=470 RepID=UPI001B320F24|nr:hypothetical protein [Acinetobacter baumannii]MBP4063487.1 hypothetical protein [Acinetobacter baumannii]
MKERPILFNSEMVRAILEGRKTQTRRLLKEKLISEQAEFECGNRPNVTRSEPNLQYYIDNGCPFGQIGDRLWVRETWRIDPNASGWSMNEDEPCSGWIDYKAGGTSEVTAPSFNAVQKSFPKGEVDWDFLPFNWRPSIHMPRWASRILLEITEIRVERLNEITEADAKAEGLDNSRSEAAIQIGWYELPVPAFRRVWEWIYGKGSWKQNPWVWVVEFKVIQGGAL